MILHIVRSGETVRGIADNYQCEVSDITSNNLHITDFKNLKPGMKLKIPFLTKPIMEVLEETESFISDYYPSLTDKFNPENVKSKPQDEPIEKPKMSEEAVEVTHEEVIPKEKIISSHLVEKSPRYIGGYSGNVIPPIPEIYIKKI